MENVFNRSFVSERKVSEDNPRKVTFIASDSSRDSHGTVVNQDGWDLRRFNSNGIIGYQHEVYDGMNPDNVIGKGFAYVEDGKLMVDVEFEPREINELADKIYQKVMFGSLKAVSVGFSPLGKGHWGEGDERSTGSNPTYYFGGQELLEVSVVNIPSNANALKKSFEEEAEILRSLETEDEAPVEEPAAEEAPEAVAEPEPVEEEQPAVEEAAETEESRAVEETETVVVEAPAEENIIPEKKKMEKRNLGEVFFAEVAEAIREHRPIEVRSADSAGINAEEATACGVTLGDIITPMEKGLIIEKAGVKVQWGLEGEWISPKVNYCEATIAGEGVQVSDADMDLTQVKADPKTSSYACPVTAQALAKGGDNLRSIILGQCTEAATRSLNDWLVKPTAIANGIKGCFVDATAVSNGALTYAKLQELRGTVESNGIHDDGTAAYVMNAANAAALRATQRGSGDRMVIENGEIDGIKVIISEYVGSVIEYGVFSYALVGQFGPMQVLVDPYTLSNYNKTRFVLNTLFDVKPARQEAFAKMSI